MPIIPVKTVLCRVIYKENRLTRAAQHHSDRLNPNRRPPPLSDGIYTRDLLCPSIDTFKPPLACFAVLTPQFISTGILWPILPYLFPPFLIAGFMCEKYSTLTVNRLVLNVFVWFHLVHLRRDPGAGVCAV